ncbi:MAG: hypothetical protein ACLT1A_12145 [Dysosmobacter sp.]
MGAGPDRRRLSRVCGGVCLTYDRKVARRTGIRTHAFTHVQLAARPNSPSQVYRGHRQQRETVRVPVLDYQCT